MLLLRHGNSLGRNSLGSAGVVAIAGGLHHVSGILNLECVRDAALAL